MNSIDLTRDDALAFITLNDADRMNPLNAGVLAELHSALRAANNDTSVRAIILGAAGPNFSAGGDLGYETELNEASVAELMRLNSDISSAMRHAPQPIIASARGWCLGGGCELLLHCDLALLSETAKLGFPETRWGLLPFFYTPQLLPLIVGERVAREMLLLGRSYDAAQSLELGLCNAVVPDDKLEHETRVWAEELCLRQPRALGLVKLALNGAGDMLSVARHHEAAIASLITELPDYRDGVENFFVADKHARRPRRAPSRHQRRPGGL